MRLWLGGERVRWPWSSSDGGRLQVVGETMRGGKVPVVVQGWQALGREGIAVAMELELTASMAGTSSSA